MRAETGQTLWQLYLKRAAQLQARAFHEIKSKKDWDAQRPELQRQFMRSVGLDPLPERVELKLKEHGEFKGAGYRARNISYQILNDCWATAVIFYPDPLPPKPAPGVLYACGHWTSGIVGGQDHGMLWARRGYICLMCDTLEQHDNPGDHHGLWKQTRFDWLSLGYSSAGGELWNTMRALDVLEALPEVDAQRIGATGNSGGGSLSFFLGIADPRIKAVASACGIPVALETLADRHLQDHCDCMYFHNVAQRDTSEFAALIAPRPLLFAFAAQDNLFSNSEYRGLYERTKKLYRVLDKEENCALCEYPGEHGYMPETILAINQWFDRHVAGEKHPALELDKFKHPEQVLAVFNGKTPEKNHLHVLPELLTPIGSVELPQTPQDWPALRTAAVQALKDDVLRPAQWPDVKLEMHKLGEWLLGTTRAQRFSGTLEGMEVYLEMRVPAGGAEKVVVGCAQPGEQAFEVLNRIGAGSSGCVLVALEPRGTGYSSLHPKQQKFLQRAGALIGLTPALLLMQDLAHFIPFLRSLADIKAKPLYLYGRGEAGIATLYHTILNEDIAGVVADEIPGTHRDGGHLLGILRVMDIQHAAGLLAPRPAALVQLGAHARMFWGARLYARLGCAERLRYAVGSVEHGLRHVLNPPAAG